MSLPYSERESAWIPPWNRPTQIARIQNSTALFKKNAANSTIKKYASTPTFSMRLVPKRFARLPYAIAEGNATNWVTSSANTSCVESMSKSVP